MLCGSSDGYSTTHNINEVRNDKVSQCNELLAQVAKRAERAQLLVIIIIVYCTSIINVLALPNASFLEI